MRETNIITKFFSTITTVFSVAVSVIMLVGLIPGHDAETISTIYVKGGVSHSFLIQIILLSIIISFINILFEHKYLTSKGRNIYLVLSQLFIIMTVTVLFISGFKWFQINNTLAWVSFLVVFIGSFILATIISVVYTKKKDKEYELLLNNFKNKRKGRNK